MAMLKKTLLSIFLVLMYTSLSFGTQRITLSYEDADWSPWYFTDDTGVSIELIKKAASNIGLEVELKKYPWSFCGKN